MPIKIPSHPYVLVNRSVLCNCGIEVKNHFLLNSLAACQDTNSKLVMYFTINTAFVDYLDKFPNLTESLEFPIIRNKTTFVKVDFSQDQKLIFVSVVKLLPVYNMASSGLWNMFTFIILKHQNGVWENVFPYNINTYYFLYIFGRCCCL